MRQFAIFAVLALCLGASVASKVDFGYYGIDPYAFESTINETIEGLRPDLPDPLEIADLPLSFPDNGSDTILIGTADLSNFALTGLQGFQLTALNFAMVGTRLNFTVVLPTININSDWLGDIEVLHLIPLYGGGKVNIHIEGLEIQGSAQADLNDGIQVKNLRLQIYVGASTFDIHGVLDSEDMSAIVSQLLNDLVTPLLDNHQQFFSNFLSPLIEAFINSALAGISTDTTAVPTAAP